jgi:hypothetical protein
VIVGLLGIGVAIGCTVAFIAATVRADARVHEVDPAATSPLVGWQRVWLIAAVLIGAGSVLWLIAAVFGAAAIR